MRAIDRNKLPERLQDEGLSILWCSAAALRDDYVSQLVTKSLQPHIQEYEGPEDVGTEAEPGRFRSVADYRKWAAGKERVLYMMVDPVKRPDGLSVPDIGGIIWFGKRENEHAPGRSTTFAIRNYAADPEHGYGQYAGVKLGQPFMEATHEAAKVHFPDEKLWLELVAGNEAAQCLYTKAGYEELATVPDEAHGGERVVMVNDTAFSS